LYVGFSLFVSFLWGKMWLKSAGFSTAERQKYATGRHRLCDIHWKGLDPNVNPPVHGLNGGSWMPRKAVRRPKSCDVLEQNSQEIIQAAKEAEANLAEEQRRAEEAYHEWLKAEFFATVPGRGVTAELAQLRANLLQARSKNALLTNKLALAIREKEHEVSQARKRCS
jgi:hypothetical protein